MSQSADGNIVAIDRFIQATRDSGYKGTTTAVAELIDNALEAESTCVDIIFRKSDDGQLSVVVRDNGNGMLPSTLRTALQFGGSTRFNSRSGIGRYGMGLPNSSLSHARHIDVYTWTKPGVIWWSYLDVDDIIAGHMNEVPRPQRVSASVLSDLNQSPSGTVVIWSRCDRLDFKTVKPLVSRLHKAFGRLFRYYLWQGRILRINGERVHPTDPLFMREIKNHSKATEYGPPMLFEIKFPKASGEERHSTITAKFSMLPIDDWHRLPNEVKRERGISKGAGLSIVRAGREIDCGWFFMGNKRRENYDDWWRGEVSFDPQLDEWFGVTNTKQGIYPTEELKKILSPDIEKIAHELNNLVRKKFLDIKGRKCDSPSLRQAESRDHLLEPPWQPPNTSLKNDAFELQSSYWRQAVGRQLIPGLCYRIEHRVLDDNSFFVPVVLGKELVVLINEGHPFYERVYAPIIKSDDPKARDVYRHLELVLFAAARAECGLTESRARTWARSMRMAWSETLATFLE
jgi:hypothetical protein